MTTIYLIRHAEAEGNLYRRIHGWYDALITPNGYRQMAALEERFRDIPVDEVFSSDLHRTMTTARAVYQPKGLPLHTDPRLRELNFGDWEDRPWGEVYHFQGEQMALFNATSPLWRAPGGEDLAQAGERLYGALLELGRTRPGKTLAVFSHGTAIRQALAKIKGLSPEDWHTMGHSKNTAVSRLTLEGDTFTIDFEGDASHLPQELTTLGKQMWWKKGGKARDVNLWYRPLDREKEEALYLRARQEAWTSTHGPDVPFDGEGFLRDARLHLDQSPWGVTAAMADHEIAGLIQLDTGRYSQDGAGYIPFFYLMPQRRGQGLAVQLLGHAVAFFRPLGRDRLRLRCAPYNTVARHFYEKCGFVKIGQEQGSRVPLDIMELYMGYDR